MRINARQWLAGLPWYDAYNAAKHDRESHFDKATLGHVITSLCAIAAMLAAQYGEIRAWRDHLGRFIEVRGRPKWRLREQFFPRYYDDPEIWFAAMTAIKCPALT